MGDIKAFDVYEISKLFNITPQSVRKYLKEGRIKANKFGTKWYITEDAMRYFLTNREIKKK
jgi:excisionase family DNA binding protein